MTQTLKVGDIVDYLELGKSRAELSFRLEILKGKDPNSNDIKSMEDKLHSLNRKIETYSSMFSYFGVQIPIPNEIEIARLNGNLSGLPASEIAESMKKRSGQTYELLAARGVIIKQNFENRDNIAKLSLLILRLQKDIRAMVNEAVGKGRIDVSIPILKSEEPLGKKVACVLCRLGIHSVLRDGSIVQSEGNGEIPVRLSNRTVWVTSEINEKLAMNMRGISELSPKIQLKNAVRYIQTFNDEEEKEYAHMQNELLRLLKEQDELLKDFNDENDMRMDI